MRRVFLDSLIAELSGKVVSEKKWATKLESLRSIKKKVTERRSENLSWVAKISLFVLPLLPLAYLGISEWIKPGATPVTLPIVGEVSRGLIATAAAAIIFSPYLAALITLISRIGNEEMKGRSIVVAFNRQTDEVTTEQLIREDEATTLEFNAVFDELIEDASKRGSRIVLVLDNLDRLANDQIRDMWATMRNLFASTHGTERKELLKNVWLIVPIDRQHIEAVFSDGDHGIDERRTRGFVEKTFEILLRVPPPLLSNWREFFSQQLLAAFSDKIDPNTVYRIFRLYELHHLVHPRPITPRAIKSHINKVVAQAKLSGDTIPLEYQSLYVLYKDEIAEDIRKLQNSSLLDQQILATVATADWTKYLAAAHFNVAPEAALELLLSKEIEAVLLAGDVDRLADLSKTHGFSSVLHDVVATNVYKWASEAPGVFFDVAATLDAVGLADVASSHIWQDFAEAVASIVAPFVPNERSPVGVSSVVRHAADGRRATIARLVMNCLTRSRDSLKEGVVEIAKAGDLWFSMVDALLEAANGINQKDFEYLSTDIQLYDRVEFIFSVTRRLSKSQKLSLANFKTNLAPNDIANGIVSMVTAVEPPTDIREIVLAFIQVPRLANWQIVISAIKQRLATDNPKLNSSGALRLIEVLSDLALDLNEAGNALNELGSDGSLQGLIQLGRGDNHAALIARVIDKLIDLKSDNWTGPNEHPHYGQLAQTNLFLSTLLENPNSEPDVISALSNITFDLNGFDQTLDLALPVDKKREVFREMFRRMARRATFDDVNLAQIAWNYPRVAAILGDEGMASFFDVIEKINFDSAIAGDKWKLVRPEFLTALRARKSTKQTDLVRVLQLGLETLTGARWLEVLKSKSNEFNLLAALIESNEIHPLATAFYDGLLGVTAEVVNGAKVIGERVPIWKNLPRVLSESLRPYFYKSVRDELLSKQPKADVIEYLLDLLGVEFLGLAELGERSNNTIIRTLIDPLLASGGEGALRCVEQNVSSFAAVISRADENDVDFVVGRLSELLKGANESKRDQLKKIAESFGLSDKISGGDGAE